MILIFIIFLKTLKSRNLTLRLVVSFKKSNINSQISYSGIYQNVREKNNAITQNSVPQQQMVRYFAISQTHRFLNFAPTIQVPFLNSASLEPTMQATSSPRLTMSGHFFQKFQGPGHCVHPPPSSRCHHNCHWSVAVLVDFFFLGWGILHPIPKKCARSEISSDLRQQKYIPKNYYGPTEILFQTSIFGVHGNFPECIWYRQW